MILVPACWVRWSSGLRHMPDTVGLSIMGPWLGTRHSTSSYWVLRWRPNLSQHHRKQQIRSVITEPQTGTFSTLYPCSPVISLAHKKISTSNPVIFFPSHTAHGELKAIMLKWFPIPFSSGPAFDGILAELFWILKDDSVKVLHSICQQIRKTQQ